MLLPFRGYNIAKCLTVHGAIKVPHTVVAVKRSLPLNLKLRLLNLRACLIIGYYFNEVRFGWLSWFFVAFIPICLLKVYTNITISEIGFTFFICITCRWLSNQFFSRDKVAVDTLDPLLQRARYVTKLAIG